MGHFHNPPPGPIAGATAAQPYAQNKLPPAQLIVPNPPFINANKTPTALWQNAVIGQPDPWVFAFERGNSGQPYASGKLPASLIIVPNPPFINANKSPTAIWQNAAIGQPDLWTYSFQAQDAGQPYAAGKLPSSFLATVAFISNIEALAALNAALQAWQPRDPPIQLPRNLSPGIPGQSVDNPPLFRVSPLYPPDTPVLPWQPRYVPQGVAAIAAQVPYFNAWLASVLQSWQPGDPPITLPRNLSPFFTAVRVDNPPPFRLWQNPYPSDAPPLPQQSIYLPQGAAIVVQGPYVDDWLATVLQAWQPGDPPPTLPGKLSPGIPGQSVDNPPGIFLRQNSYPPDLWTPPQQLVLMPQGAAAAAAQNPYVRSWLSAVLASWQPGDPPVMLPRNLNVFFTAAPVDNPPFTSRTQLPNILLAWPPFEPVAYIDLHSANTPQQGTTPSPPTVVAQFTVSGGDVSVHFTEFFSDVVFTDAPITKRTN